MEKVQDVAHGPADELAKTLSKSDFQKAAQALDKLQKKLADSQLDAAMKEELTKQLRQLKQKIDQMAQQAKDAQADLQKRADHIKQTGDPAAGKLEDEIQKLQQQGPQMMALQNLANKLGQCSKQMQEGQNARAAEAMQEALQQMQDLARQQSELQTLDSAMRELADARRQMNGEPCDGDRPGGMLGNGDKKEGKPGKGVGQDPGDVPAPRRRPTAHSSTRACRRPSARERPRLPA